MSIIVREKQTGKVLKEFSFDQEENAYAYVIECESYHMDVELIKPSVTQTLGQCLGANQEEMDLLKSEMDEEIGSHHESCCFSADEPSNIKQ